MKIQTHRYRRYVLTSDDVKEAVLRYLEANHDLPPNVDPEQFALSRNGASVKIHIEEDEQS